MKSTEQTTSSGRKLGVQGAQPRSRNVEWRERWWKWKGSPDQSESVTHRETRNRVLGMSNGERGGGNGKVRLTNQRA
ncbi:EsV-1-230 [Ectocarpus siliculosus virus 1]|uniref:EsV-1-230 n=1 Tax=Ectocarpus siliculosus virus 1 (isolate New Zealand/Kaikoura/1988) TaxID=654926 RepID=Q8QN60_ESV1K|nr:EsV-1-230 [Ectocarpus siliculosus virus 1]AAK14643.1 EsV-1-230 [Ectocarpus siliculosus virus 1]